MQTVQRRPGRYQVEAAIAALHRWHAVRGHLHELDGDLLAAATAYAEAAQRATNVAERDHLVRQAARARAAG
jgi:predicted RNA polymerase sigma factor